MAKSASLTQLRSIIRLEKREKGRAEEREREYQQRNRKPHEHTTRTASDEVQLAKSEGGMQIVVAV